MEWRFLLSGALRHPEEPRVLLLRSDRAYGLPRVRAKSAWVGNAKVIVPAFERRLGTTPWLLRQLRLKEDEEARRTEMVVELTLVDAGWQSPRHGRWIGRSELAQVRLRDEEHRSFLDRYLGALERNDIPAAREPWARPEWRDEVRDWVQAEASRMGHRILALEQVKHWSISSVLRIVTDGPDLFFKASAALPLFVNEARVTRSLSERFPGYVPAPLAIERARGWMLLPSFSGLIEWDAPLAVRQEMFRRFAGLQRNAVTLAEELLVDGCLDRRLDVLEAQLDPLLADPAAVARLTPEERAELLGLGPVFKEAVRRLGGFGLPPTLVHGDLHPGNVARHDGQLVYFDWTDACVSHPFIDLHSLRWESDHSVRASLLASYLEPWEGVAAPEVLREAAALAAVVIPLHHAVSYQHIVAGLEPSAKPELDATHGFLREALVQARAL